MNQFCRHCGSPLNHSVLDLGHQPPSNAYLSFENLSQPELTYPLEVLLCTNCWLVQVPAYTEADQLFTSDYAYLSSTSSSWCNHARKFVKSAINRLNLNTSSFVIELASNDGYLLQYMKEARIPCLGIEPTHIAAEISRSKGIETIEQFFGYTFSQTFSGKADLVVANNVLAHVPDINDFMHGISTLLSPKGFASIEFQHLMTLISENQFDTIYHEHYSYLSLNLVKRLSSLYGLILVDVERIPTHGGSLRVWLTKDSNYQISSYVDEVLSQEISSGLETINAYDDFQKRAFQVKIDLIRHLVDAKTENKNVLAYGAAAKGNTLLNYAGIQSDLLPAVADMAASKQGKYMPGSHIPIVSPVELLELKPDSLLVLPWNLIKEIRNQFPQFQLTTPIPYLKSFN